MPPERKHYGITAEQRKALRQYATEHPRLQQSHLKTWFEGQFERKITQPTISESLSTKYSYLDSSTGSYRQRRRAAKWPELETSLFKWQQELEQRVAISGDLLKEQARIFWQRLACYQGMEMPPFSDGWLAGFKSRHGMKARSRHGEAGSLNEAEIQAQLVAVQATVRQFSPQDVYNCDETGLFWKWTPNRGLSTRPIPGTKQDKARITAHFCCNADGSDKLHPWLIGTAAQPRCFGNASININSLNCVWRHNGSAWMTSEIMIEWLYWFDRHVQGRKVLLLMDNFSAHTSAVETIKGTRPLQNVVILWLPPNSTSKTQPLDQGIIRTFKAYYRKQWLTYMVQEFEAARNPLRTINVLKALRWTLNAWSSLSPQVITNCWRHSQLISKDLVPETTEQEQIQTAREALCYLEQQCYIRSTMDITSFLNPEEETIQDSSDDITERIAAEFDPPIDAESDEEEEILPRVTYQDALDSLQKLRLFEEQQEDGQASLIEELNAAEAQIQRRRERAKKQHCITHFFK